MKSETDKRHFINLPEESHPDYFRILVRNCIAAYSKLYNDTLALDFNKVLGSMRGMILEDKEYQRETRSIKAQRMMAEVDEIDSLIIAVESVNDDGESGDPRNRGKKKTSPSVDRDLLMTKFKASQARRDILNLTMTDESSGEANAITVYYVTLTPEEFLRKQTVEMNEGDDDGSAVLTEASAKTLPDAKDVEKALRALQENGDDFKRLPDGSWEEV